MKNFRNRSFTKRVSPITQNQIERLRATRLKNATTFKQRKFYSSAQFDKQLRSNVRANRAKANMQKLDRIVKDIGGTKEQEQIVRKLFGEKTSIRNGRKVKTNTFTSQRQTKRLQNIQKSLKAGKFNFPRYLQKSKLYKDIKQYLPDSANTSEVVYALSRGGFYFENKGLIQKHNANVKKYGSLDASTRKAGIDLRNKHYEKQNEESQDFIDFVEQAE